MKGKLLQFVKYTRIIYTLYFYLGSWTLSLLKLLIHSDKHTIIFSSFGGKKFDDSPKCIYDAILKDNRFNGYRLIWAFQEPDKYTLPRGTKVKIDTFNYFKTLLKAGIWITNSSLTRGLYIKGTDTFSINTWHGTPIKHMGSDTEGTKSFRIKKSVQDNVKLCQSHYELDIFSRVFNTPKEIFHLTGLPRNDELSLPHSEEWKNTIKEKLGIKAEKKVILYAPTFRDYEKNAVGTITACPPIQFDKWKEALGDRYVLLVRMHYEVTKIMDVPCNGFSFNVSNYPNLNELILISDMLISDYSSIFFDYSITGKPMLCFAYDYEKYSTLRGMYFDIRKELDMEHCCNTEEQIIAEIQHIDMDKKSYITKRFRDKYVEAYGTATRQTLNIIADHICIK